MVGFRLDGAGALQSEVVPLPIAIQELILDQLGVNMKLFDVKLFDVMLFVFAGALWCRPYLRRTSLRISCMLGSLPSVLVGPDCPMITPRGVMGSVGAKAGLAKNRLGAPSSRMIGLTARSGGGSLYVAVRLP